MPQVISTSEPTNQEFVSKSHEWLVDAQNNDLVGVRNYHGTGNDLRPLPIALTAAQIAAPSADMLAATKYTYALNVAPFTRYHSTGTALIPLSEVFPAKLTEINVTAGTLAAGNITGAGFVSLVSINATPGTQTTRTATQMFADQNLPVGSSYTLRITNTGAGTLTLGAGAGVTLTGTMTVPVNTTRDFIVTFNSATTLTIRAIGTGTFS